ncbi:hypothetical protein KC19_10G022500 [Ceratodon purpureus]|uniref:Uncharacterized protein n=1 Tax=Ceratodon purpureus TaxID=3225 RepID=A0A8T0GH56_CERPU|nr:hypothetical protein KC19_10G022500 [Ceratodon purpureus]
MYGRSVVRRKMWVVLWVVTALGRGAPVVSAGVFPRRWWRAKFVCIGAHSLGSDDAFPEAAAASPTTPSIQALGASAVLRQTALSPSPQPQIASATVSALILLLTRRLRAPSLSSSGALDHSLRLETALVSLILEPRCVRFRGPPVSDSGARSSNWRLVDFCVARGKALCNGAMVCFDGGREEVTGAGGLRFEEEREVDVVGLELDVGLLLLVKFFSAFSIGEAVCADGEFVRVAIVVFRLDGWSFVR